jgi:hypothetical protein
MAEVLEKISWKIFCNISYHPDLAASDFHLFGSLKETVAD